jgi:3-dehydroquinate dehydratase / shikimate dehydrogenase
LKTVTMPAQAPLPKICIALGLNSVEKLVSHARHEVESGERFLEFRLDYLPDPMDGSKAITAFLKENPECTVLATCRRHQNHGKYDGSIPEQIRILEAAVDAGAVAVDLEIESAENATDKLDRLRKTCKLIISYHNFDGTPSIEPVYKRMAKIPAYAYKIVSTAKKPSDAYKMLALAKAHPKDKLVVLAMGEPGFPTRVLAPAFGSMYTYAAPNAAEGTASGQVSAKMLRHLFRVDKFTKAAKIFGVVADPVRHSISPNVHNRAFQHKRMDAVYLPLLVHGNQLKDFFQLADSLPLSGASVTIPHKQKIIRYLDVVEPLARRIGAVNTIWKKAGKWRGTNTDAEGVTVPLAKRLKLSKATALIVGNGGAARGAAFALSDAGAKVSLVGRNLDRVRALARICNGEPLSREQAVARTFDVVVHCTPMGMWPHAEECFFDDRIPGKLVFDMVYNPRETMLLKMAKDQGAETIDGVAMFLEQAARQFEIFTGETAPRAVMERAAVEALNGH